jgi:hypothetical protein
MLHVNVRGTASKLKEWRRRALQRKGAAIHAAMSTRSDRVSLAMLNEDGMVVCWYDDERARHGAADRVVHRHFSQFYVSADAIGTDLQRRLSNAIANGRDILQGWRKRSDGSSFWGATVIEPVLLRNGTLQGFSHVTRPAHQPTAAPAAPDFAETRSAIKWPWTARASAARAPREGAILQRGSCVT